MYNYNYRWDIYHTPAPYWYSIYLVQYIPIPKDPFPVVARAPAKSKSHEPIRRSACLALDHDSPVVDRLDQYQRGRPQGQ